MFFIYLLACVIGNIISYFILDFYQRKIKPVMLLNKSVSNFYNSSNSRLFRSFYKKRDDFDI